MPPFEEAISFLQTGRIDVRNNTHIHHPHIGAYLAGNGIDPGTSGKKRLNHGRSDLLGIGAHAFFNDPMVAGHHQDGLVIYGGLKGFLDSAKLF